MPKYKITGTRRIRTISAGGTPLEYYVVDIQTPRGSTGSVDVPLDKWDADILKELLDAAADELDLAYIVTEG